ncbi:cation:proton antiporter family protein [Aestuariirhabdus litorea]|uniref:Potassium transporter Kef n=1 Tax=Aestuariirhabdus litorea TaxID=2528527 RepID=A0A3P3VXH7_9GAMM|nr:cation:proton antiporter family protein [Aestuariirhabdus litorea]RRJ85383.1 potassium transporter Kef [Aestuariirhabdus litorea]RWW98607.1 potassium transporter Kef [Endozoicomonadaceae bacterium GTF-13]
MILLFAFVFGLAARQLGLPPLVGFLLAGFGLNFSGVEATELLQNIADLGVTLLLFSIGLKLDVRQLLKPEIWLSASLHMGLTVLLFIGVLKVAAYSGLSLLQGVDGRALVLIGFALSFSSTVFAVKVLEDKGEVRSLYGQIAIGILIMQDLFAVLFISASKGEWPSPWALSILLLPLIRPLMFRILDRVGHGEVLVLCGLFFALIFGAELFYLVGLKPDLGALLIGMLLASHDKAGEMAKALFNLKELFLVAFFLTIGLTGLPTWETSVVALLVVLVLPLKVALYFALSSLFGLRARTSMLSAFALANYSEFGLIVAAIGWKSGLISEQWLIVMALALSFSFILSSPLNSHALLIYQHLGRYLNRFQRARQHPSDRPLELGNPEALVFGMGRIGAGCYDSLRARFGDVVVGIEHDPLKVQQHREEGRRVELGDATDSDFWDKLRTGDRLRLVMLAMPHHHSNLFTASQLRKSDYQGRVAAVVRFNDEAEELQAVGVSSVFNMYEEAGAGFADHVCAED